MDFLSGALAASGAVIVSNPFDVIKTRMQLQGELSNRGRHFVYYKNPFQALFVIARTEGLLALQKGFAAAVTYQAVMNGTRLGLYQTADANGWTRSENGELYLPKTVFWGSIAGVVGATLGSPLYLVKTQIQSNCDQSITVGHQHHHQGFLSAFRNIYRNHGFVGIWAGVGGSVPRAMVGSAAQLSTFSSSKDYLKSKHICKDSPILLAFLSSCISGIIVATFMSPFDVISTRLYNQNHDTSGKGQFYKGVVDCMLKIYTNEGLFGYYKGFGALYLRMAPHTTVSLVLWDWFSRMHRLLFNNIINT